MADEPTAIRHPGRGKAHRTRPGWASGRYSTTCCNQPQGTFAQMTERVPLSQVAREDRCRTCWKEQS